eukprot:7612196-Pyramimonas_sp.AAC.1
MGQPRGTDTATPRTSPRVRSDQNVEANPAVATRASQEVPEREHGRRLSVWVPFPRLRTGALAKLWHARRQQVSLSSSGAHM